MFSLFVPGMGRGNMLFFDDKRRKYFTKKAFFGGKALTTTAKKHIIDGNADMVELADTQDLESCAVRLASSNLVIRTRYRFDTETD